MPKFQKPGVTYEFHHIGYVCDEPKDFMSYSEKFDLYTGDVEGSRFGAQFHCFGKNHPFHSLMAELPHVGFKVNDIEKACEGEEVIMAIYEPIPGYKAAMINDAGIPVEFVQTDLTEEELMNRAKSGQSMCRDIEK